jgi:hypothetical protein
MPNPPAALAAMKTTRRMSGSTPSRRPSPAQTPATTAPWRSRRSGGCEARWPAALMSAMFSGPLSAVGR